MFNRKFLTDLAERAISTAAQAALSLIGIDALFDSFNADWQAIASVAAGGAVLSVLKGLAARHTGDPNSASFV